MTIKKDASRRQTVKLGKTQRADANVNRFIWKYKTPEGFDDLVMCGDGEALTGLWFEGSRDDMRDARGSERRETPGFRDTCRWLDEYFAGHDTGSTPRYRIEGATPFRRVVIDEMLKIPYGATVSYGDIADGSLTGYGGGLGNKASLLAHEGGW